jgi:hypothetical protein
VDPVDCIYSPPELAARMISKAEDGTSPAIIADFAAGDGQLLKTAREKWPESTIVATDINKSSVALMRRTEPDWQVGSCNFLSPTSRDRSRILPEIKGKVSLVLLNPPFSCRGNARVIVNFNGDEIRCGLALAFVLISITYLSADGQLIAVLPAGCIQSQKDAAAWEAVRKICHVKVVGKNGHKTFSGWSPKTVIVKLKMLPAGNTVRRRSSTFRNNGNSVRRRKIAVSIFRGKLSMHEVNGNKAKQTVPLIHSTELEKDGVNLLRRQVDAMLKSVRGPAVLVQRVGRPEVSKILPYLNERPIVLSDCVIALKCVTANEARVVKTAMVKNWEAIEVRYGGTCARYITVDSLRELLNGFGFEATVEKDTANKKN